MALIRSYETQIDCKEVWNDLGMRQAKRFVTCSWSVICDFGNARAIPTDDRRSMDTGIRRPIIPFRC